MLGVWFTVATFSTAQIWVARSMLGEPPPFWPLVRLEYPVWFFWVAASIVIVVVTRRAPLERRHMMSGLTVHLTMAVVIAALFVAFKLLWYQAFNPYPFTGTSVSTWFWRGFREWFILGFVLYWAVVGVYHAFANYAAFRRREADLNAVTLQALRSQLHPHFLFNTLNTVSAVLERDPRQARRLIGNLAELLRASLRAPPSEEARLDRELSLLEAYLEIERTRFGARLRVDVDAPAELAGAVLPTFVLQPLVENAVQHGIAPRENAGRVVVQVRREAGRLRIRVDDDGSGGRLDPRTERVGIGNTRRRLHTMYGSGAGLQVIPSMLGGFAIEVFVPYRQEVFA